MGLKMIEFTRSFAQSKDVLAVISVRDNAEPFDPDGRFYRYDHNDPTPQNWTYDDFHFHIQSVSVFLSEEHPTPEGYFIFLSSEGDVYHTYWKRNFQEKIAGAGSWSDDVKGYGRLSKINEIDGHLYACGDGGQIYVRGKGGNWDLLTNAVLYDPEFHSKLMEHAPDFDDPSYLDWMIAAANDPKDRNIIFFDIKGISENALYLSGVVGPGSKPVLCFWDGSTLHELKVNLPEAALTGIYIENPDSVWVCGREGVLLHGSYARGFTPVTLPIQLNLFHMITPYRGKLVMPASVRPGGLYEYDPKTGAFGKFDPPLPRLRSRDDPESIDGGPFFAQAVGDVLWVVGSKDIFRFDGREWDRIEHPDV